LDPVGTPSSFTAPPNVPAYPIEIDDRAAVRIVRRTADVTSYLSHASLQDESWPRI